LLAPLLFEESVELAGLSCKVDEYLCEKSWERLQKKSRDVNRIADYSQALNAYSVSLSRLGLYEQAYESSLKSVELYSGLLARGLKQFEPAYALSLSNIATHLSDIDRNEEAHQYADKALGIRKRLWQKNPDRFEPDYAMSLSNYANRLSDAGRDEEALQHAQEALVIRRGLAQKNPERYEPDYAKSLNNCANRLSDVGRYDHALQQGSEALEIRKRLAQKNPDRYEPDYATSLNNYAGYLSDAGRYGEALHRADEAVEVLNRLAQKRPARFAEDHFTTACFVPFLLWLCPEHNSGQPFLLDEGKLREMLSIVPDHRRTLMFLYYDFVSGCGATDLAPRKERFHTLLSHWSRLSSALRTDAEPYWLCAAAWGAKFDPIASDEWRDAWRQFKDRRNGRIPHWMIEVARRLEFDWPD